MKRRILILIVFLIILLISPKVFAAGSVSIVSNEDNVINGDEFDISVDLLGVPAAAFQIEISFDGSKLDYISGPETSNKVDNTVLYMWVDDTGGQNPIQDGTVVKFKFKAKATGVAVFGISGMFFDKGGNNLNPVLTGTQISISNNVGGDVLGAPGNLRVARDTNQHLPIHNEGWCRRDKSGF